MWERILEVVSRFWPKFQNRITWAVVLSGLALIAAPLWERIVSAIISKTFDLSDYIPNEPILGVVLVVLGLLYHLGASIVESQKDRILGPKAQANIEHDRALANRFLDIVTEDEFLYQLEMLGSDHSCDTERWNILAGMERFADRTENEFLNDSIQEQMKLLRGDLNQLTGFIVTHFFPMNNSASSGRSYLYPDCNIDRKGTGTPEQHVKYSKYSKELLQLVNSIREDYEKLRRAFKTQIAI